MKKKTQKIIICISLVIMLFVSFGNVFGATNPEYAPTTQVTENALDYKIKDSILLDSLANLINAIASLAEYLIGAVFTSLTGDNIFPWADRIIFNGIGFLDINFLNPADNSLFGSSSNPSILGEVVQQVYSTIFSLAVLFLGVAVGIMAIRLAISSIAAEKAKYKQAIVNWVTCIVMLFLMHYILAFVFWINEQMVRIASGILIQTIADNNITTTNFKEALNNVIDPESRVKNFISSAFAADSYDTMVLTDNVEITNNLITNQDYVDKRLKYVDDSGKNWYEHVGAAFANEGGMVGDVGLPRLAYDVEDAKAIKELSDKEKNSAKKKGYYFVNGHPIFITWDAYRNSDIYKYDLAVACYLAMNNSAGDLYWFYKDNPHLKINDPESPNLWQAWTTTLTWDWYTGNSGGISIENYYNYFKSISLDELEALINDQIEDNPNFSRFVSGVKYRMTADKYIINAAYGMNGIENGKTTDIIANLGSFFKQSAYVYTSESTTTEEGGEKQVITGWRASKVSVTGALLYGIFIFQSCIYFIMYVKRLFYIIMLSLFGPIVVIYDFFIKSAS